MMTLRICLETQAVKDEMPSSTDTAPVGEEGEEVGHAYETVVVEVGRAAGVKALWFSNIHD